MVLTPQMAISHLVMTIGVGIIKKNINKFYPLEKFWVFLFVTPPDLVQISWNDPYMYIIENKNTFSVWLAQC